MDNQVPTCPSPLLVPMDNISHQVPTCPSPLHGVRVRRFHRFKGYDYSRGGSMFTTLVLKGRPKLFGVVDHDQVLLSPNGEYAKGNLVNVAQRFNGIIRLHKYIIMPDHVHLRFSWPAGIPNTLKAIGNFVGRFKQFVHYHVAGHAPSIWEEGYHDLICTSERMNRSVDAYIGNNALKWWLMYADRSLMHVKEPFLLPTGDAGDIWRAVGNSDLAEAERLVAIRISRRVPTNEIPHVVQTCANTAINKGYTYVSTFYSPGERALFKHLATKTSLNMIRLIPTFLDLAYRPHGDEPLLFAKKRLLVISRMADPAADPTRPELLDLNAIAAQLAWGVPGGKAIYVKPVAGRVAYSPLVPS